MQFFFGVLTAVLVFSFKEWFVYYVIDQARHFRTLKLDIGEKLTFYCNIYTNLGTGNQSKEKINKMSNDLRLLASRLSAFISRLPKIRLPFSSWPPEQKLICAKKNLIRLSNASSEEKGSEIIKVEEAIRSNLDMPNDEFMQKKVKKNENS